MSTEAIHIPDLPDTTVAFAARGQGYFPVICALDEDECVVALRGARATSVWADALTWCARPTAGRAGVRPSLLPTASATTAIPLSAWGGAAVWYWPITGRGTTTRRARGSPEAPA